MIRAKVSKIHEGILLDGDVWLFPFFSLRGGWGKLVAMPLSQCETGLSQYEEGKIAFSGLREGGLATGYDFFTVFNVTHPQNKTPVRL